MGVLNPLKLLAGDQAAFLAGYAAGIAAAALVVALRGSRNRDLEAVRVELVELRRAYETVGFLPPIDVPALAEVAEPKEDH